MLLGDSEYEQLEASPWVSLMTEVLVFAGIFLSLVIGHRFSHTFVGEKLVSQRLTRIWPIRPDVTPEDLLTKLQQPQLDIQALQRDVIALRRSNVTAEGMNTIMKGLNRAKRHDRVLALFDAMKGRIPADQATYVMAIGAAGTDWTRAMDILDDMHFNGFRPTLICYTQLIRACAKAKRAEEAYQLLQRMQDDGVKPDAITFNTAMFACVDGRADLAHKIFYEMSAAAGVARDLVSYNTFIHACANGGAVQASNLDGKIDVPGPAMAVKVLHDMIAEGLEPDLISFNTAIHACDLGALGSQALQLVKELESRGFTPDSRTWGHVIGACVKSGKAVEAFEVMKQRDSRCVLNRQTYVALVHDFTRRQQWQAIDEVIEMAKDTALTSPDRLMFNQIIAGCAKAGKPEIAFRILSQKMPQAEVSPDCYSFHSAISGAARMRNWELGMKIVQYMDTQTDLLPNTVLLYATISMCERSGEWEQALSYFEKMKKLRMENEETYTMVIRAHVRRNDCIGAQKFLDEMRMSGYHPSEQLVCFVLSARAR